VNEFLTVNMERVKPENPELKRLLINSSNGLIFFVFALYFKLFVTLFVL